MPSRLKEMILEEMTSKYEKVENMIFVGYRGLSGSQIAEFRTELSKGGVQMNVVRNRITVRALTDLGRPESVKGLFDGPTAIMDGGDPVAMAKAAVAFAKRDAKLEVKGGIIEGDVIDARGVINLSKMPSREEMLSMISGGLLGVGGKIAGALKGPGGRIAGGLKAKAEKEEDASGSPEPQAA